MQNYAFTRGLELPTVKNGHVFSGINFTQAKPNTVIFKGITGLVFKGCNLMNCTVPVDAKIEDSLHIQKEFCSNKHPRLVAKGIDECSSEICEHYVKSEVDKTFDVKTGVLLKEETIKTYKDKDVK